MTSTLVKKKAMYKCNTCTLVYFATITFDEELLKSSNHKPCPDCNSADELTIKWSN